MSLEIEFSEKVLQDYLLAKQIGFPCEMDRSQIIAHATLSAYVHHWPSRSTSSRLQLLRETEEIKAREHSRWVVQRRIAVAKLSRELVE